MLFELLNSILDKGKWVNFKVIAFCFLECDPEWGSTTHLIRILTNLKNPFVSGSSIHEFEMYYGRAFH